MKITRFLALGLLGAAAALVGCETGGSANSTIRQVAANFTGVYENDGKPLASSQSGASVKVLVLNQTGDRLEAFDDRDAVWKGTIGEVFIAEGGDARAPFTLEGKTTAGQDVTISGSFSGQNTGSGAIGTMSGTWIEPTLFASFFAQGQISSIQTNSGGGGGGGTNSTGNLSITAGTQTLTTDGQTTTLTATGGQSPFTWQVTGSVGRGQLNSVSGTTVTYARLTAGDNTVEVRDNSGDTATISINQP